MDKVKKYVLTNQTMDVYSGHVLYRIRALRDIPLHGVKAGDLGGWIESERNLSQDGDCWVADKAKVFENGLVCHDALVKGNCVVRQSGKVLDVSQVSDYGKVFGRGIVKDNGSVLGYGGICDKSVVCDNGMICDNGWLYGNGRVYSNGVVGGRSEVGHNANIGSAQDCLSIGPIRNVNDYITFYRAYSGIWVNYVCFNGPIDCFKENGKQKLSHTQAYIKAVELAKIQLGID